MALVARVIGKSRDTVLDTRSESGKSESQLTLQIDMQIS